MRKFVGRELSQQQSTGLVEFPYRRSVHSRIVVAKYFRVCRCKYARGINHVFDRKWDSMHGATIMSGCNFLFGNARLIQCQVGGYRNKSINLGIESVNALKQGPDQFNR